MLLQYSGSVPQDRTQFKEIYENWKFISFVTEKTITNFYFRFITFKISADSCSHKLVNFYKLY